MITRNGSFGLNIYIENLFFFFLIENLVDIVNWLQFSSVQLLSRVRLFATP